MKPIWATFIFVIFAIITAVGVAYFIENIISTYYPNFGRKIINATIIDIRFDKKIKILLNTTEYGILYFEDYYPLKYHIGEKVKIRIILYGGRIEVEEIIKR